MGARKASVKGVVVARARVTAVSELLLQEERPSRVACKLVRLETESVIQTHGAGVVLLHFERELAASEFARSLLDPFEQTSPDA